MRRLLSLLITAIVTVTLAACGGSSTGPDDNDEGNNDPATYSISVDVTPADAGSISGLDENYEEGETVELQATPNDEYVFAGWVGDVESPDNPLLVTMEQDYNLTANFELKNYELTINTDGEGSVQEEIVEEKSKEYEHGTVVELTATPADGYRFVEWTGDVDGSDNPAEITVDDPKEVTAVFEKKSYPLTINTEGDGAVSEEVVQQKTTDYEYETVVKLTANPNEGWGFVEWQRDLTGNQNSQQLTIDRDKEVTAVFEQLNQTFYLAENGVTVKCEDADVDDTGTVIYTKRSLDHITTDNAAHHLHQWHRGYE